MSDLPPKPAHYDTAAWIKWLEAHVDHLMGLVPPKTESPLAIGEPVGALDTGAEDIDTADEGGEPPKG